MKAEECLKGKGLKTYTDNFSGKEVFHRQLFVEDVAEWMEDYAKKEAIEFLKWDEENFGWTGIKETKEQKYNRFKDEQERPESWIE
jgi:hypothetical protein